MAVVRREICSPNGDRWFLARDRESGDVFVVHQPNAASGGNPSQVSVGAFLVRDGKGPEHQEFVRLIGTLVEGD